MKCDAEKISPPEHSANSKNVVMLKISWVIQHEPGQAFVVFSS